MTALLNLADAGSPPRARGAGSCTGRLPSLLGITPACAGSSRCARPRQDEPVDHPRVRGEQIHGDARSHVGAGSPPRARGADRVDHDSQGRFGITPACAGSSGAAAGGSSAAGGSPPRARGAGSALPRLALCPRITPACAGSRPLVSWLIGCSRDHPRVRGEQILAEAGLGRVRGSPPRARGAAPGRRRRLSLRRITPACAGSRGGRTRRCSSGSDHPRVRGEQLVGRRFVVRAEGSPPRARGAADTNVEHGRSPRITPACAGSRFRHVVKLHQLQDHPRVRGEQDRRKFTRWGQDGSPPRARGAVLRLIARPPARRITPACAGSRLLDLGR